MELIPLSLKLLLSDKTILNLLVKRGGKLGYNKNQMFENNWYEGQAL